MRTQIVFDRHQTTRCKRGCSGWSSCAYRPDRNGVAQQVGEDDDREDDGVGARGRDHEPVPIQEQGHGGVAPREARPCHDQDDQDHRLKTEMENSK